MNIQLLAALLLVGRIVSELFIVLVLRKQWKMRKIKTHPRLMSIRRVLFALAVIVFIGNLYPLVLDIVTLLQPSVRTTQNVNLAGVAYSLDNNLTFLAASFLIYTLYKLADTVIETAEVLGIKGDESEPKRD